MDIKIKGTIEKIGDVQSFKDGKFQKREVVLLADEPHAKRYYPIEFIQGDIEKVDALNEGLPVVCTAEVSTREWNGRWFVSLRGISVDSLAVHDPSGTPATPPPAEHVAGLSAEQIEDLPF